MKSFMRIFNKIRRENPYWSDYICFAETVFRRKFSRQTISHYFNKLVAKDEYSKKDKKLLLEQLFELSQANGKTV